MNASNNFHDIKTRLILAVDRQVAHERAKGPTYHPDQTRICSKQFGPAVVHMVSTMRNQSSWRENMQPAHADQLLETLAAAAEEYTLRIRRFQDADTALATAQRPGKVYSAATRRESDLLGVTVARVRTVVSDALNAEEPLAAGILESCGYGKDIRYTSPVEVQRYAGQQLMVLNEPVSAEYLLENGVSPEVLADQLSPGLARLNASLEAGRTFDLDDIRQDRDDNHLAAEILSKRILAAVGTALGTEKRDELRAMLPTRRGNRKGKDGDAPGTAVAPLANIHVVANPDSPFPAPKPVVLANAPTHAPAAMAPMNGTAAGTPS